MTVGPTDFGSSCRDAGTLVSSSSQDVVINKAKAGQSAVRLHAPRQRQERLDRGIVVLLLDFASAM